MNKKSEILILAVSGLIHFVAGVIVGVLIGVKGADMPFPEMQKRREFVDNEGWDS